MSSIDIPTFQQSVDTVSQYRPSSEQVPPTQQLKYSHHYLVFLLFLHFHNSTCRRPQSPLLTPSRRNHHCYHPENQPIRKPLHHLATTSLQVAKQVRRTFHTHKRHDELCGPRAQRPRGIILPSNENELGTVHDNDIAYILWQWQNYPRGRYYCDFYQVVPTRCGCRRRPHHRRYRTNPPR